MPNSEKRYIFFVDDDASVHTRVGEALEKHGFAVTCFSRARTCLDKLQSKKCDLLVTEVKIREMDGIDLLTEARHIKPWVPVLFLSGCADVPTVIRAFKAGAVDFVEKPVNSQALLAAVTHAVNPMTSGNQLLGDPLTSVEMTVLSRVLEARTNKEIGRLLDRSQRAVEVHRSHIMAKLGVDNVVDLIKRSAQMRLVKPPTHRLPEHSRATIPRRAKTPENPEAFIAAVTDAVEPVHAANRRLTNPLTRTEMRVLNLILNSYGNKEIAYLLRRSDRTIEVHRRHIMTKLGVGNIVELVNRSAEIGLLNLDKPIRPHRRRLKPPARSHNRNGKQ